MQHAVTERLKIINANIVPYKPKIVAVTKYFDESIFAEYYAAGLRDFGENRVQDAILKISKIDETIKVNSRFHLIGHLQTNKVKYIVDKVCLIHSVDSVNLAKTIEKEAAKHDVIVKVLIEVNVAGEESKFGVSVEDTEDLIMQIKDFPHIQIEGLMTIAPFVDDPEDNRVHFRRLRELLLDINSKNIDNVHMNVLSMGMTNDYEVAVEEGATMVRVGTGIFGARNYNI